MNTDDQTTAQSSSTEPVTLALLRRQAFDDGDWELVEFFTDLEHELITLRTLGKVVGHMYQKGGLTDENWQALFEALSDANMLGESSDG